MQPRRETPSLRIAAALRRRIASGELGPGDRLPSTRKIAEEWDVAIATATRALGALQREGLTEAQPGVGTVVAARRPASAEETELSKERIVRAAIGLADAEGLAALSMRGVAAKLDAPPMSLYRHVAGREALVMWMIDAAFGEQPLPPKPAGWRARLQLAARTQWALYRRHPWMAQAQSLMRPVALPRVLRHAEWVLSSLDGHGLDAGTMMHIHMTVFSHVLGVAINLEAERQAESATGMSHDAWVKSQTGDFLAIADSEQLPTFKRVLGELDQGFDPDLDTVFEFGLRPLLDGLTPLFRGGKRSGSSSGAPAAKRTGLLPGRGLETFEEMHTLCRFFVLEGCYTAEQLAALSQDEVRTLDEKIRVHTERCRGADGVYRLEQDEDLIIIPRP